MVTATKKRSTPLMKDYDYLIAIPRSIRRSAHGVTLVEGEPVKVICSVEGRAQQAGMFSISGAESKTPETQGGLIEVTPIQILCREWHGDIYTLVYYQGDWYDMDGAPTIRRHGTQLAQGIELRARRILASEFASTPRPEPEWEEGMTVWGAY